MIENGPYSGPGRHDIGCHQTDDASFWCAGEVATALQHAA